MTKKITIDVPEKLIPVINNIITDFNNTNNNINNTVIADTVKQYNNNNSNNNSSNNNTKQYEDYNIPTIEDVVNYTKSKSLENVFDAVAWFEYWNEREWTDTSKGRIRRWTRMLDYAVSNSPQFNGKTVWPKESDYPPLPDTIRSNRGTSIRRLR